MSRPPAGAALEFDLAAAPAGTAATVAVLLHGRGSDKSDLLGLQPMLPRDWALVTPRAPFPAAPWGYGPGYAWYRYQEEDRVVTATLDESLSLLETFLGSLASAIGFEPRRLVLGGFSQGGTVSLAYVLSRPNAVAAALNFSGFLAATVALDETGAEPPRTPLFWGHGIADPAIPIALAEKGRNRLRRAGAKLVARDYRIGHWIAAEEVDEAVAMVQDSDEPAP